MENYSEKFADLLTRFKRVLHERDNLVKSSVQLGKLENQMLQFLYHTETPVNMNILARELELPHSRITIVMDGLVEKGLVVREHSVVDRRKWFGVITELGRKYAGSNQDKYLEMQEKILQGFTPEEMATIHESFVKYIDAYENILNDFKRNIMKSDSVIK